MRKKAIALSLLVINLLADSSVIELSPISVVATGDEQSIIEQPLSVTSKSEKEIKLDQVIFQKDLLNSLSGVRVEQTGSVIGHTTAIRMPENKGSYYLFMQDGIPVQSSGFFNHNGLAYTTYQSASSVEVLKGAGTALYGSDAVAAVINVESLKKPSKEQEVSIKGMGGSDGYSSGALEVSDTIDEKSSYRASAGYMHSDGWRKNTESKRFEANIRYDRIIDDYNDIKVLFNTSMTDAEQADSFNFYENVENGSTVASDAANNDYLNALNNIDIRRKFDYARLSAEWSNYSFDNLEITFTPYIRYNRNRYVATWEPNFPSSDNETATVGFLQRNRYDASWGRLIAGVDAEYTESSMLYTQEYNTSAYGKNYTTGALFDYDVDYTAIAPYIHLEHDITKTFMLTAGLRYDYNHYDYKNKLAQNSNDSSGVYFRRADRSDSYSHLSPKLSLNYTPLEDINLYIRYANGFGIPQASTLYSLKANTTIDVNPETSNTYEIGIKKLFGEKSYAEAAVYYMSVDDTITRYKNTSTGDYYYSNGGSTIHKGVEATLQLQATNELAARIAYSYSKHNYDNDSTFGDNEIGQAPNHLANTRLIYTPTYINGFTLMGEWQYVGSYWMDDYHTAAVGRYGGYSIGNLKADYNYSKKVRLFAKINNITDERYAVSASYAYGRKDYNPGDPRQFYAGFEYRW